MLDRYVTQHMKELWSLKGQYESWLQVELCVLKVMEKHGAIPKGTHDSIVSKKIFLDIQRIQEIENTTKHDIIAFLTYLEETIGEPARWIHFGLTSSDVLDTSLALRIKKALKYIIQATENLLETLRNKAILHANTLMVGRTHGIHAQPMTLGLMFAGWYSEIKRNIKRLKQSLESISYGKISGAIGTYGIVTPEMEKEALNLLGLKQEPVSTQVIPRDRHAEVLNNIAIMASSIERFAINLRHMQRTELSEIFEPFSKGQKGSSAMPHKKNPILLENITGLARTIRSYVVPGLENIALWHERDISHSSVERIIIPDSTALLEFAILRMTKVIKGLEINEEKLLENLWLTKGLIFSGSILLELVKKGIPRTTAYEAVQKAGLATYHGHGNFKEMLKKQDLIKKSLTNDELDEIFSLGNHLKYIKDIINRTLEI